jgi:hypothetical protein
MIEEEEEEEFLDHSLHSSSLPLSLSPSLSSSVSLSLPLSSSHPLSLSLASSSTSSTLPLSSLIALNDVTSVANLFLSICPSKEEALKFLELVCYEIDPNRKKEEEKKKRPLAYDEDDTHHLEESTNKIARPESEKRKERNEKERERGEVNGSGNGGHLNGGNINHGESVESTFIDVIKDIYDDESSHETSIITLAALIPNDMGLSAYIIGKQGANVAEIRRKTKARTQLEQPKLIPPGITERNIFFMGTIRSVCEAYQHVFARIVTKAETLPAGCLDDMKMVIPSELSALLIGKGGVNIKKIQSESGARTHVQSEDEMIQSGHYYGRAITISGTFRQRCHAMYLILKNVTSFIY